ncbi:MAG: sigma 54-interacting transcriptional regulator [Candidatus Adiutrix sp.]|jgi:propionate catabolism regulator PrpR|nr:sigma 54-interacting transcriptional regulator [Candidatus Adiutrix sp.]
MTTALPYNFSLLSPYREMVSIVMGVASDMNCRVKVRDVFNLDEAERIALETVAEDEPEVILSRGGTAEYVRAAVDTPVVSISMTALDLLRTLLPFRRRVSRVAFFKYKEHMPEVQSVAATLGMTIDEYVFLGRADMVMRMMEAKAKGAQLGVGGVLLPQMSETTGLKSVLMEVGEDAVSRALWEACSLADLRRTERRRLDRLQTILQSITEGILVTDDHNRLVLINQTAENLMGIKAAETLGLDAREVIPNTRTAEVLKSGLPERNEIQEVSGQFIVTSRAPIISDGRPVGVVCTFSEADSIRQAEHRLRGRLQVKGFSAKYRLSAVATRSPAMEKLKSLAEVYAATGATILLEGESGTGKELFAQGIHLASKRMKGPFVAVNCAAIPESLLESELFGYEEGSFTGARRQGRAGYFEMAHRGTLFLDEIGELPLSVQARLLRVLQEKEVVRLGGAQVIPVDLRIICATNRDLEAETSAGSFRRDLFYRLNVLPLRIPPLREREGDVIHLARLFLGQFRPASGVSEDELDRQIGQALRQHQWPGNVRELRNVVERLALAADMFPEKSWAALLGDIWSPLRGRVAGEAAVPERREAGAPASLKARTPRFEKETIQALLAENGNDQERAAALLGISRMSLWRKLRQGE